MKSFPGLQQKAAILVLACASLTTFASSAIAQQGMFVPTGSTNAARIYHSATLLNNGIVLIAGGQNASSLPLGAELYDPSAGRFTFTGNLNTAHSQHTATLLNNGNVLIAGGADPRGTVSAELYDPVRGTFTTTGSMIAAGRYNHTATLLQNGTVLITGGNSTVSGLPNGQALFSAELYDPATGTFTPTGNMNSSRENHTATLLNNGMVLIAGGDNGFSNLASAELYDPKTGIFTLTGSMSTGRNLHTATLLNNGTVLVAGGNNNGGSFASAELYVPSTGTFTPSGSMNTARSAHTATLLDSGTVLIAAGNGGGFVTSTAELYDPATGTFSATESLNTGRDFHRATLVNNGTVLVVGGEGAQGILATAELYELVVISPTGLSFSGQVVGTTSAPQTVTLTNNQSTALSVTSLAFGGTNASDFAETDNCIGSIAAGASCSINVTFTPGALGSRVGSLNITNNLSGSPMPITLTGTGITATRIVSLSTSSLTFTNQMVGLTSPGQGITLNNTGNSTLTISGLAFSGTNASEFAETDNCSGSVASGASCTISVTFSPAATGTRTGTLSITDDATSPPSPQTVALTGTAIPAAPIVSLSSMSVVFPNQTLGTASAPQTVTLSNTGAAILNIQAVALAGANSGDFAIASGSSCTSGATVAPKASCVIQVIFTPAGLGARSATVGITDNAADSPETIGLSGTTTPTPLVSVTPSNITFPAQYVGTSGLPQSATLTNNGNAPLSITSVTTSANDFGTLNACGSTVAAGSSCSIGVFFDPTASGARSGTLTINDNAPGSPHTVALSGTGQDFSLAAVTPASTTVTAGQTANYTVAVSPAGGFNQTVALTCTGGPALSTCAVTPNSVSLNGTVATNVAVSVTTMAAWPPLIISLPRADYRLPHLITELFALSLLIALLRWRRVRPRLAYGLALLVMLCAGVMMSACGSGSSGGNQGTPPGSYPLVVSGTFTSGSTKLTHSANLTLVVQ